MDFDMPPDYSRVNKVVIFGVGGSAIGGDLVSSLTVSEAKIPIIIYRGYNLPAFIDAQTLVIASSCSGMTEETLSPFRQTLETESKKLAVTTGGKLKEMAEARNIPVFSFDYRAQPRAALAFSLLPILGFLSKLGCISDKSAEVAEAVEVQQQRPGFAYFAETFLAPRDVMAYGDEVAHLEASEAEVTLGDLQSTSVGSPEFVLRMRQYLDVLAARSCAPCFTIITADKDDPRFDEFYLRGNAARLFIGLLADMPSYMSLGFELRDPHLEPAPNEHYTKLYVFQETSGPKATTGSYVWGENGRQLATLTRVRLLADALAADLAPARWLLPPDPTLDTPVWAWTQRHDARHLFVVNVDTDRAATRFTLPSLVAGEPHPRLTCIFSTAAEVVRVNSSMF